MMNPRILTGFALIFFIAAGCAALRPQSGAFPPNPQRGNAAPATLIDTVPTGHRCIVTGGAAQPLTLTTPRLVALYEYGDAPVIDCFGAGFLRQRKAVQMHTGAKLARRMMQTGAIDPAFGPYPKQLGSSRMGEFPAWVRIRLPRAIFDTAVERDRHYAAEARWFDQAWSDIKNRLQLECQSKQTQTRGLILLDTQCKNAFRALADRQAADRAAVEGNRRQSTIR